MQQSQHEPCEDCKYYAFLPDVTPEVGSLIANAYEQWEVTGVHESQLSLDKQQREWRLHVRFIRGFIPVEDAQHLLTAMRDAMAYAPVRPYYGR